jgi:DNA-binding winged helix-turn-helix (wHTH) protein/tetratricopeptide (TPR) repeat protein
MIHGVFHFGDCAINIAARELLRGGERVNLSPVVFDCLAYLIEHRDRAVGRDELVAAVWGKAGISDAVMGKTILVARRAIGDTAEEQRYLRTVPRFGYQWGAPTRFEPPAADAPAPVAAVPVAVPPARTPRAPLYAMLALLALAGALIWLRSRDTVTTMAPPAAALAADVTVVLPVDVAANADDGWLRLGLMDYIATRLRAAGVTVLPSDNVVRLVPAGTARDAAVALARGVAVRSHVVAGAVRRAGDAWFVRAELIEPDGATHAAQAQTDNAIGAGAQVADQLLDLLGRRRPDAAPGATGLSLAERLQRVDAARLAGDPAQARALIAAADTLTQAAPEMQLRLAQIDLRGGAFEASRDRLATLVAHVSAEAEPLLHARAQSYYCIALARTNRMDAALPACDRAIALFEPAGRPDELGRVYNDRGIIRLLRHEYDLAARDFAQARVASNLAGDALQLTKVEGNESTLEMAQGRYAEAVAIQQRIGERFARFGMHNEVVASLNNQTDTHLALLQPLEALKTNDRALALIDRVADASIRYLTKLQRADALARNGRLGEARQLFDEVLHEADGAPYAPERAIARTGQAGLNLAAGRAGDALLLARQALPDLPAPPYGTVRADAWLIAIRSLHALDRTGEAAEETRAFAAWSAGDDDPVVTLYARLAVAEQAAAERRDADARHAYDDALAGAKRWGVPNALAEAAGSYGRWLLARGELSQAATVLGLVARYAEADYDCAVLQLSLYRTLGQEGAARNALATVRRLAGERPVPPDNGAATQAQ